MTRGTVSCRIELGEITNVSIINDQGGTGFLPEGEYEVELIRAWDDYEIGGRAEGVLTDPAQIELSRQAGRTGRPPLTEPIPSGDPRLDALMRTRMGEGRERRVFFDIRSFKPAS